MRLNCPHCHGAVKANPIGRWYARFQCPHCRRALQWSPLTNLLGVGGSLLFFIAAYAAVMGREPWTRVMAASAAALWVIAIALSYGLRKVIRG